MKYLLNQSNQRGMALVVGLILLAAATIITVAGMQGMQMQERMTSGQNNKAISLNAAEAGASRFANGAFESGRAWWEDDEWQDSGIPSAAPGENDPNNFGTFGHFWIDPGEVVANGDTVTVTVRGLARQGAEILAETRLQLALEITAGGGGGPPPFNPFADAGIIGCEGVATTGSSAIDSYDSRLGAYNENNNRGHEGHVMTTEPDALIQLLGNAPIFGNVNSTGGVVVTGSSNLHGNINATGHVQIQGGGAHVHGDVYTAGDLTISSSGTVHGNAFANGNIGLNNWHANIFGNAQAGGTITTPFSGRPPEELVGGTMSPGDSPGHPGVPTSTCDTIGIDDVMAEFDSMDSTGSWNIGNWGYRNLRLTPDGVEYWNNAWRDGVAPTNGWETDETRIMEEVELFGDTARVLKVSDFALGQDGTLEISGGDVVLVVDGNLTMGGNTSVNIAPGSSLTVLVTGTFNSTGTVNLPDLNPIDSDGRIPFSVFSSYEQASGNTNNPGFYLGANNDLPAVVYAPKSHVGIGGSGALFGQVRGKTVSVTGNGDIHYDVALGDFEMIPPGGGPSESNGPPVVRVNTWHVTH